MAKKKTTQQAKDTSQPENAIPQVDHNGTHYHPAPKPTNTMEDPAQKLQSLKQLNDLLLKETSERRNQVESLKQANEALKSELNRSGADRNGVEAKLARADEEVVQSEIEKNVFCVFMATQLGKMGTEIENMRKERDSDIGVLEKKMGELVEDLENQRNVLRSVSLERDEVKSDLDLWVREANALKSKIMEMEQRERKFEEEVGKLREEHQALIDEKEVRERAIEAATREKDLLESNLSEKVEINEGLKREIERIVREKSEVEAEKCEQQLKIAKMEKKVVNLDEIVFSLRKEEGLLQAKVAELERRSCEAMEKEKEMAKGIKALEEEKKEKGASIEQLLDEKSSLTKQLEMIKKKSEDTEKRLEALSREKNEVEEVKASQESEIVSLREAESKLRGDVFKLQESCREQEERNKQLLSEVSRHQDLFEQAMAESNSLRKNYDEEKKKVSDLNSEVAEIKKEMEENVEELKRMTSECDRLLEENSKIESGADSLAKEKDSVEKKLSHAQQCIDGMRLKVESAGTKSERALALLKNTAALVSQSKGNLNGKEVMGNEELHAEIQPYLAELEAIKDAFSTKERTVADLKQQIENLGNSVAEAHKKKSFWTLVSSATTIFAAISVAYVARGR